jgi:hypothetical protein
MSETPETFHKSLSLYKKVSDRLARLFFLVGLSQFQNWLALENFEEFCKLLQDF